MSPLHRGDVEAAAAEWGAAIACWKAALSTPDQERAEIRLQWFLESAARPTNSARHRHDLNIVLLGTGAAVFGTGLVLMGQRLGDPWRDALALSAWIAFVLAAGCGVLFAYQHRPKPRPALDASSIDRARELAEQMDAASATMPIGPRLTT